MAEDFAIISAAELAESPLFKTEAAKPDETWSNRIKNVPVGSGFRVPRVEGETPRQLKRRVNAAAVGEIGGFKKLEWKAESKTLPDGLPASYVVKVVALNLTAKAEYEKAQTAQSQNGQDASQTSQEAAQTTEGSGGDSETPSEGTPAQGRVRGR